MKKNARLEMRVSPAERALLQRAAKRQGISVSELVRRAVAGGPVDLTEENVKDLRVWLALLERLYVRP